MCTYAVAMAPVMHFFYTGFLVRLVPLSVPPLRRQIVKKVGYDYVILGPIMAGFFIFWNGLLDRMSAREILEKVKRDFWILLIADGLFWPTYNYFNFMFVLPRLQTSVIYLGTLISASILSAIESRSVDPIEEIREHYQDVEHAVSEFKDKLE